jgi:hypothetical protein
VSKVKITWKALGESPESGRFITSVELDVSVNPGILSRNQVHKSICEGIFHGTNVYGGGYWALIEPKLSQFRTHTALSVGDEIEIDGQVYICADFGFEKIEDVEIKYHGDSVFRVKKKQEVSQ